MKDISIEEMLEQINKIPEEIRSIESNKKYFDIYAPEIQAIVKEQPPVIQQQILRYINSVVGHYLLLVNSGKAATRVYEYMRKNKRPSRYVADIKTTLDKIRDLTELLPNHNGIESKIQELENEINEGLSYLKPSVLKESKENLKKVLQYNLKMLWKIEVSDRKLDQLSKSIETSY